MARVLRGLAFSAASVAWRMRLRSTVSSVFKRSVACAIVSFRAASLIGLELCVPTLRVDRDRSPVTAPESACRVPSTVRHAIGFAGLVATGDYREPRVPQQPNQDCGDTCFSCGATLKQLDQVRYIPLRVEAAEVIADECRGQLGRRAAMFNDIRWTLCQPCKSVSSGGPMFFMVVWVRASPPKYAAEGARKLEQLFHGIN